ncbi:MAG: PepSY domain-containing protein [Bifidobacteriaceae bacterium]|nr:PepSY domain-containing protein [Bifidobacteriaceae bacterium]
MTQQPVLPAKPSPRRKLWIAVIAGLGVVMVAGAGALAAGAMKADQPTVGRIVGQPITVPAAPTTSGLDTTLAPDPVSTPGAAVLEPTASPTPTTAAGGIAAGNQQARPAPTASAATGQMLTEEQAKQIALAQVPGATSIRLHLEYDDGRAEYEGEIIDGWTEHEFEMDAYSGEIREWESDHHQSHH